MLDTLENGCCLQVRRALCIDEMAGFIVIGGEIGSFDRRRLQAQLAKLRIVVESMDGGTRVSCVVENE